MRVHIEVCFLFVLLVSMSAFQSGPFEGPKRINDAGQKTRAEALPVSRQEDNVSADVS